MKIIKNEHNKQWVNLDKTTSIYFSRKTQKIHFIFDSMIEGVTNEVIWELPSEDEYDKVLTSLERFVQEL